MKTRSFTRAITACQPSKQIESDNAKNMAQKQQDAENTEHKLTKRHRRKQDVRNLMIEAA